jgi:hypothetical protein
VAVNASDARYFMPHALGLQNVRYACLVHLVPGSRRRTLHHSYGRDLVSHWWSVELNAARATMDS